MDTKQSRTYLTLNDIEQHSIWKFNDNDDLYYPVISETDLKCDAHDLSIRTTFTTPYGLKLLGCTSGVENIFSIAIYLKEKIFYFNKNFPSDYTETLKKMSAILGKNLTIENFSPLKYITDIDDLAGLGNIEGEFDLLKKRTNEERLKRFEGKI